MRNLFFLLLLLIVFSCANPSNDLIGKWSATSVLQDDKVLDLDLNLVGFEFDQNGKYSFTSTLDYREAGDFHITDNKLITLDTIHGKGQKSVLIERLDEDTLQLRMKNPDGWMQVTLAKE
jgi:hypothetical protein